MITQHKPKIKHRATRRRKKRERRVKWVLSFYYGRFPSTNETIRYRPSRIKGWCRYGHPRLPGMPDPRYHKTPEQYFKENWPKSARRWWKH